MKKKNNYIIKLATALEVPDLYKRFIEPYFPENEKKPLKNILKMMQDRCYQVLCIEEEGVVKATAFLATYPDGNSFLLDYLAVDIDSRSKGFGGILLKECTLYTNNKIVFIETERVENATNEEELTQRIRRNAFYERNGASKTQVVTSCFDAVYNNWVLTNGIVPEKDIIISELTNIYNYFVPDKLMYKENIFIPFL